MDTSGDCVVQDNTNFKCDRLLSFGHVYNKFGDFWALECCNADSAAFGHLKGNL